MKSGKQEGQLKKEDDSRPRERGFRLTDTNPTVLMWTKSVYLGISCVHVRKNLETGLIQNFLPTRTLSTIYVDEDFLTYTKWGPCHGTCVICKLFTNILLSHLYVNLQRLYGSFVKGRKRSPTLRLHLHSFFESFTVVRYLLVNQIVTSLKCICL